MKSELITEPKPVQPEIDWSKPMVVKSPQSGKLVLTDGRHSGVAFSGTVIHHKDSFVKVGDYASDWDKDRFTKCTEPVTITFTND